MVTQQSLQHCRGKLEVAISILQGYLRTALQCSAAARAHSLPSRTHFLMLLVSSTGREEEPPAMRAITKFSLALLLLCAEAVRSIAEMRATMEESCLGRGVI